MLKSECDRSVIKYECELAHLSQGCTFQGQVTPRFVAVFLRRNAGSQGEGEDYGDGGEGGMVVMVMVKAGGWW